MRKIFYRLVLPLIVAFTPSSTLATVEESYPRSVQLVQQQIYLIYRLEKAFIAPDPNKMRAVRGQLTLQNYAIASFLKLQNFSPTTLCTTNGDLAHDSPLPTQLNESQAQVYCSLSASGQKLSQLRPVIDEILSRRGESALIRELPLVSGERQPDPILTISPIQRPDLGQPAPPFFVREPDLTPPSVQIVGVKGKTAIANYLPPIQPAIAAPQAAMTIIESAKEYLQIAETALTPAKLVDPEETNLALDRFAYEIDVQEPEIYAKLLELPNTGIFRVLPSTAYSLQLNTLTNRLLPTVRERYPFPVVDNSGDPHGASLALQMVDQHFQLVRQGIDYGFITDLGDDLAWENLDASLSAIPVKTREFVLHYQPPQQLAALQIDRQRFLTGKDQNWGQDQVFLTDVPARLNHTYLVRSLQFQLPDIILRGQPISRPNSRSLRELNQFSSSDTILAFRPVNRRADGSYTIIWRLLNNLPAPTIEDLENYLQY
jgi:hypothetical protein